MLISYLDRLPETLDTIKAIIEPALVGWNVHFKELSTIADDQLPSCVLYVFDDSNTDKDLRIDGTPNSHSCNLIMEFRAKTDASGSIIKTLAGPASTAYKAIIAASDQLDEAGLEVRAAKTTQTLGNQDAPNRCGLIVTLQIDYLAS